MKSSTVLVFGLLVFFSIIFSCYGYSLEIPVILDNWLLFEDELFGVSFYYPSTWLNHSSQERGIVFTMPDNSGMLTFRFSPLFEKEMDLEEFTLLNKETLYQLGAKFIEEDSILFSGFPAQKIVYTIPIGKDLLKYFTVWSIVDDGVYILTLSQKPHLFDKCQSEVEKVIDTLQIQRGE